ncbi:MULTISPECIES: hypothetical protein [Candidatus Cryosericum]|jgi:hypothetical protein|nr:MULTISPECIES: hypothetical protein [Cryosericum]RIE11898.1 hypothetical protein SMC2_08310 [Candidatus Cryosericum hinesii]RIE11967.1 hypothetical protein SMC3_08075 [Candidatus Cryosericum hinesii]
MTKSFPRHLVFLTAFPLVGASMFPQGVLAGHYFQRCFVGKQELPEEPLNVDAVVPSVLSLPMSHSLSLSATNVVDEVLCSCSSRSTY